MSLEYYRIFNDSNDTKQFGYTSGSTEFDISPQVIDLVGVTESIIQSHTEPYNIPVGTNESTFLSDSVYPGNDGYAWLWNDGYKVKYIKVRHITQNNQTIAPYINNSSVISFLLTGARNAAGNHMYLSPQMATVESYKISNSTQKQGFAANQNYNLLSIDQDDILTSFAVDSDNKTFLNFNFSATGDYIWYATASGRSDEPITSSNYSRSLAQGYFPANIQDFGSQQVIRGWSHANYYVGDDLINFTGTENDPLNQFHTGSTERDNDTNYNYDASTLPFFINAPASTVKIEDSDFKNYTGQSRTVQIGPVYSGSSANSFYGVDDIIYGDAVYDGAATAGTLSYFYKEDTNEILIQDPQNIESQPKSNIVEYDFNKNIKLVGLNSAGDGIVANITTYTTEEGHVIPVGNGEELWLYRGYQQDPSIGDINVWNYNKYLHRPYKIYMVTVTGSNTLPSHIKETYISYSSSLASERQDDGAYIFATTPIETIELTASIKLTASLPFPIEGYDEATYGNPFNEYDEEATPTPPINTWETASLRLHKGTYSSLGVVIAEEFINYNPSELVDNNYLTLSTDLEPQDINLGTALRLSVTVYPDTQTTPPNSALLVTEYSMSISASAPATSDLVPTYLDNILLTPEECNPVTGNAIDIRPNSKVMDIDYSGDVVNPINFNQLINYTATKASTPDSYYTSKDHIIPRYLGSKTSAEDVNSIYGLIGGYGKSPVIDYERAFFAYSDQVIDLYPLVNNKTLFNIKYLIDANGNALQPNLSKFTGFDVRGTWDEGGVGRVGVNQIPGSTQFDTLNGQQEIYKVAKQPIPILYSQNGSSTYSNFIPIIGNPKEVSSFSAEFLQYSMDLAGTAYDPSQTNDKFIDYSNIVGIVFNNDFSVTTGSRYGEYDSTGRIYASSSIIPGNDIDPYGDNSVFGKFVDGAEYTGSISSNTFAPTSSGGETNVVVASVNSEGSGAKLDVNWGDDGSIISITGSAGNEGASYAEGDEVTLSPNNGSDGDITLILKPGDLKGNFPLPKPATWGEPGEIYFNQDIFAINGEEISGRDLSDVYTIKFDGSFFSTAPFEYRTDAGGWNDGSDYNKNAVGHLQVSLEKRVPSGLSGYTWKKCKMKQLKSPKIVYNFGNNKTVEIDARAINGASSAGLQDNNTKYYILCKAMDWFRAVQSKGQDARKAQFAEWKIKLASDEELVSGIRYRWKTNQKFNNEHVDAPRNLWNPTSYPQYQGSGPIDIPQGPYINMSVTNASEGDGTIDNALNGPYWEFPLDDAEEKIKSQIQLVSPNGNASYDQGYIQGYIPYTSSANGRFPGGFEPADTNFPNFNIEWKVEKNDEIRFENNELSTYKIIDVIPPGENITDSGAKLKLILDRPVSPSIQKDFFLIRRYVEADNVIIIDKLFPYGGLAIKKESFLGSTIDNFEYEGSRNITPDDEDAEEKSGKIIMGNTTPKTFTREVYSPLLKKDNTPSGVLFPEFAIKEIDFNTDEVIRDLRDKKLIE